MKGSILIWLTLMLVAVFPTFAQSNSWKGIVPLRSTRADVEKTLGVIGTDEFRGWKYDTVDATVYVGYTSGNCEDGWNVPKDRVFSITVYDKSTRDSMISAKDMGLERERFAVLFDDASYGKWVDAENGFYYYFSNGGQAFISKTYFPRRSDNELRCNGFPPYAPDALYAPYEYLPFCVQTENVREFDERLNPRVHASMHLARESGDDFVYVLVYFDRTHSLQFYRKRLARLRNHANKIPGYSRDRIFFIEGGLREESQIEFYILSSKVKPPAPRPTLPSPQFMRPEPKRTKQTRKTR